jgi:hypothetical protein
MNIYNIYYGFRQDCLKVTWYLTQKLGNIKKYRGGGGGWNRFRFLSINGFVLAVLNLTDSELEPSYGK